MYNIGLQTGNISWITEVTQAIDVPGKFKKLVHHQQGDEV